MIRFDHVTKKYSGNPKPALDAVTLEILRGEFVFLVGASGSGKSSFLRLVLKEEKPTKGKIHVLGQDLGTISSRKVPYFRRNIGVVFQDFRLLPNKSVYANVAFTLQVIGKSKGFIQEAVPDVLGMVGLTGKESRLPHELSGGEQQRVAIARAVVNKPQVLLADEPTGNLDPATSAGIMALLERINAGGTTVLMATHEADIVDRMQRRVIELVGGTIIRDENVGGYTVAVPVQKDQGGQKIQPRTTRAAHAAAPTRQPEPVPVAQPRQDPVQPAPVHESPAQPVPAKAAPVQPVAREAVPHEPEPEPAEHESAEREPAAPPVSAFGREPEPVAAVPASEPRLADHFAAPPTQSLLRARMGSEENLPEQLSLAERLGLRAAESNDDQQDVGPTR